MNHYRRLLSAVIILPPVILILLFGSLELFTLLVCMIVCLSLREYFELLMMKQVSVKVWLSQTLALALAGAAYLQSLALMASILTLGMVLLTVTVLWQAGTETSPFLTLMYSLFGVWFIGWGLSHLVLLYHLEQGPRITLLFCGVLWSGDITAMYVGRSLGRRPMVPIISPGKTWEGALGNLLGCLVASLLGTLLLSLPMPIYQRLLFGLLMSCAAQIGDLAESLFKRYIGVKDSGTLIPGHGGLLDRLDSFCFAAPLAAYFFLALDILTWR